MASIKTGDIPMDNPAVPWTSGKLYQWDGSIWWMLSESGHPEKYMAALLDLLKNTPNGYFNNLFCMLLIVQDIFAKQISALNITLSEQIDAFGKPKQGSIQSSNFIPTNDPQGRVPDGFRIRHNGDVEFNNGVFRGHIEATSGFFKGHLIAESLEAGPLSLSKAEPEYLSRAFASGSTAKNIFNDIRVIGSFDLTGTYGDLNINRVELSQTLSINQSYPYVESYTDYNVWVYAGSTKIHIAFTRITGRTNVITNAYTTWETNNIVLGSNMIFTATTFQGMTIKLLNLPKYPSVPTAPGTVYRNGNVLCVV